MSENNLSNFSEILSDCSAACSGVYENSALSLISSSFTHVGIEEIAPSKDIDQSLVTKYTIFDFSKTEDKRLLIVFQETEYMTGFLLNIQRFGDINDCKGNFHSCISDWSLQIPIEYFLNKMINENYELIFTGYGLGASIASIVAARIIFNEKVKQKIEKVLFIGFDSPPFVDDEFKSSIDKEVSLKKRFHFYINEDNSKTQLLGFLLNILYADQKLYSKPESVDSLRSFMKDLLTNKISCENFHSSIIKDILKSFKDSMTPSFNLFGFLYNKNCDKTNYETYWKSTIKKFGKNLNQNLFTNFQPTFLELKNKITKSNKDNHNNIQVKDGSDKLSLPQITVGKFDVEFVVNELETDIFVTILCENKEFICNIILKLFDTKLVIKSSKDIIHVRDSTYIIFSCPNELLSGSDAYKLYAWTKPFKIHTDPIFECFLTSHFNQVIFKFDTHNKEKFQQGFSKKQEKIEKMDLDLLYLHAVFYINIFKNSESHRFRENCKQLKNILAKIDEIWKDDLKKTKKHDYNGKKGKAKLFERLKEHFGDYLIRIFPDTEKKQEGNFFEKLRILS